MLFLCCLVVVAVVDLTLNCFLFSPRSAISGRNDKDAQRRDSLIVQAARNNNAAAAPRPSLKSMGFASMEDTPKKSGSDDDDSVGAYATRQSFKVCVSRDCSMLAMCL